MSTNRTAPSMGVRQKHLLGWLLLGLASLATVAVLAWPASWAANTFNHLTRQRVMLLEAQGTLWNGSALLALGAGPGGGAATAWPQRLHWSLTPTGLTQITLSLQTDTAPATSQWNWVMQWRPSGWQLQVSDVDWRLPTAWLSGLGSPWNTIEPEGLMRLQSRAWSWQLNDHRVQTSGQFIVTLERFATRLSALKPLGDYQLTLMGATDPKIELKTLQGALHMQGQGTWRQGQLQFAGEAWAHEAADEPALANLLGVLGPLNRSRAILKVG